MQLYHGFIEHVGERPYRIRAYVPTTVFEDNCGYVEARHFFSRRLANKSHFFVEELPRWNTPFQTLELRPNDERTLKNCIADVLSSLRPTS